MIEPYQMLPLLARVDLEAKAIIGYSAFPKSLLLHCLVSYQVTRSVILLSADRQSVYSAALANSAKQCFQ